MSEMPERIHIASKGALSCYTSDRLHEYAPVDYWDTEYTRSEIHAALAQENAALKAKHEKCLTVLKAVIPSYITIPTESMLGAVGWAVRILEGEE